MEPGIHQFLQGCAGLLGLRGLPRSPYLFEPLQLKQVRFWRSSNNEPPFENFGPLAIGFIIITFCQPFRVTGLFWQCIDEYFRSR
jgi:hypothetical protein